MVHNMFTVYDQKAQAYLPPWIMPQVAMAKRVFGDCVNSADHQFATHPADYTLFTLGTFDDETARFTPCPNGPETLGSGLEFIVPADLKATEGRENGEAKQPLGDETPVLASTTSDNST